MRFTQKTKSANSTGSRLPGAVPIGVEANPCRHNGAGGIFGLQPDPLKVIRVYPRELHRRVLTSQSAGYGVYLAAKLVEYLAGLIGEDELWDKTGERGFSGSAARFTMGMKSLSRRDRAEAQRQFKSCVETNRIGNFDFEWAQAYLKRMEDPNWQRWLKQGGTE